MIVFYKTLARQLESSFTPLYILAGQDNFLIEEASRCIRAAWQKKHYTAHEQDLLDVQRKELSDDPSEWETLLTQMQSPSLFLESVLYQIAYLKKSLSKPIQNILQSISQEKDLKNIVVIQAPNCSIKTLQSFKSDPYACVVQIQPLKAQDYPRWILEQLKHHFPHARLDMAELIANYTQGNLFAANQVIQKLTLLLGENESLSVKAIESQLYLQCEFQNFELSDACLQGDAKRAICILQSNSKTSELPLQLWIVSNDIRQLLKMKFNTERMSLQQACKEQKIWPSKAALYQKANERLLLPTLQALHHLCGLADKQLKTGQTLAMQQTLERISLGLCMPDKVYMDV